MNDRASRLGAAVRARRERLGLRQQDLADLAGCSTRFVHALESGKPSVRLDKLLDVFEALGLEVHVRRGSLGVSVEEPP